MKKAIYYRLILLTLIAVIVCGYVSALLYAFYFKNQTEAWLEKLTISVAENYKYDQNVYNLSKMASGNRITIISKDGKVIADSKADINNIENHLDREEIKYAKEDKVYIAIRNSRTLGTKFMYASIKAKDDNILRLAYTYSGFIHNFIVFIPAIIIAGIVALVLSLFLSKRFTKVIIAPFENLVDAISAHNYKKLENYKSSYYEIDKMMYLIKNLLQKIEDSNITLQNEREKIEYILSNMSEGIILIDRDEKIVICNKSALNLLFYNDKNDPETIYNLTRENKIIKATKNAINKNESSMFDLKIEKNLINVVVSPFKNIDSDTLATIVLFDVTENRQLEEQKRDFFSNASHELKTPITSIIGFSEMLNNNMIKNEEEKKDIINRIETEGKRMSILINDILTISKLESSIKVPEQTEFLLSDVVLESVNAVSPINENTKILIDLDIDDILVYCNRHQMYELITNLIENAVKYNKTSGEIFVSLKSKKQNVILKVRDTGIGIPLEYQSRIFERFFRIDFGRNKKIEGSGLGLSIVKHIVNNYGGNISLKSECNIGTSIKIILPILSNKINE